MSDFPGTRGNINSRILIVAESYGSEEAKRGVPLVGNSGKELSKILEETGIDEKDCFFTNIINRQPPQNEILHFFYSTKEARLRKAPLVKGLYPKPLILMGVQELDRVIASMPNLELIIGFGNYTLWALTDDDFRISNSTKPSGYKIPTGIIDYRGSHLYTHHGIPFLPTIHPAAVFRTWPWRYFIKHDLGVRVAKARRGEWGDFPRDFRIRPTYEQTIKVLDFLYGLLSYGKSLMAFDIETRYDMIACLGIAWTKWDAICIPFICTENREGYWSEEEEFEITKRIRKLIENPNLQLAGQNFLFDAQHITLYMQVIPKITHDTMIMQHLIYPGTPLSLNHISSMYNSHHKFWKDEGKTWEPSMDEERLWSYNCRDCVATFEAATELLKFISYHQLEEQYKWQQRQLQAILRMMLRGILVSRQAKLELVEELLSLESSHAAKLEYLLPEDVYERPKKARPWYGSNKQLCEIFYDILGCKPKSKGRREDGSRKLTVDDEALEQLKVEEPLLSPMIELLQQYRSLKVFSSFAKMSLGLDGRARSSFTPTAETFRWKSSEDAFGSGRNLQNLPKGQDEEEAGL